MTVRCLLQGHDWLRCYEPGRVWLRCQECGYNSPGLTGPTTRVQPPRVTRTKVRPAKVVQMKTRRSAG